MRSGRDLIEARRALIGSYLRTGKVQEALALAKDAQKQQPKQTAGFTLEGDIRASRHEWNEAISAYRVGARQGDTEAAAKLHSVLNASGQAPQAEAFAKTWYNDHPKDNRFRLYMAESSLATKNYKEAHAQYQALLANGVNHPMVLNNAAWVAAQVKDPNALSYAERAFALAPNEPGVMDTYGMLLVEKGERARGIELMRKAVGAAPDNRALRLNLAKALIKDGQKDAAKRELETLLKSGDDFPERAEVNELMKGL